MISFTNICFYQQLYKDIFDVLKRLLLKVYNNKIFFVVFHFYLELSVKFGDMDIMFEPKDTFVSNIDTGEAVHILVFII